ncbi:hypothetical protein Q31b_49190 [Novipirellula aureliae]|uniref:Transporter n=1 Tax=Novipirellula aureliae TaxID=2527966 RepID=A0A5C6DIU4_9BACT|nr:transporter [Novipirellula aureliae]TWU36638.1 hypothetical protein Q31b_49190 [Novipirellula aureliae]
MKFRMPLAMVALTALSLSLPIQADDDLRSRADKHAPASLMGDHLHKPGEWMVEYKYMNMFMDGNRAGSQSLSDEDALGFGDGFFATPTNMTMEMHMLHVMYGYTEDVTLYTMLMLPSITMDHLRGPTFPAAALRGLPFTVHNSGLGDTGIGALVRLYSDEDDDLILNLGASLPTGDIYRTTSIPTNGHSDQTLPYPMRLGSGTFNARPGITWKRYYEFGSFGAQFQTDLPIGRNYRGYSVSDDYRLNAWYSQLITNNLSTSIRIQNLWRSNFDGVDLETPDAVISTNVEDFRGGYSLNLGLGAAALLGENLLNVEFVPTLYQDLNGVQLETDWSLAASWSKSL